MTRHFPIPARESIGLTRVGPKRWSHDGGPAKSVEEAALDHYRALGWEGFFTGREDFEEIVFLMMCWLPCRAMRKKAGRLGFISSSERIVCSASDGWLPEFGYCFQEALDHAEAFEIEDIEPTVREWVGTKRVFHALDPKRDLPDELHVARFIRRTQEYFTSRGGTGAFLERLKGRYPERHVRCLRSIRDFERDHDLWIRGFDMHDRGRLVEAMHFLRIPNLRYQEDSAFNEWRGFIERLPASVERDTLLDLTKEMSTCRSEPEPWWAASKLDLELWRGDDAASVEVKAPGDRLRPGQIETLRRDAAAGRSSWVLDVHDA